MNTLQQPPAAINPLTFIDRIIADIELTPTQYENAQRSYKAIAEVLNKDGSPIQVYHPNILPHGSMRVGTTVKPIEREEFDLDMLCRLAISGKHCTPDQIYELVWNVLGEHETYRQMRERRCRCIRINYAEAFRFHLDIVPAIPDWNPQSSSLYVPDRERKIWCSTHPIGFADGFFKPIAETLPVYTTTYLTEDERRFAAKSAIEPLPNYGTFQKKPLQRIVQMLKHDRDKHFADEPAALRPSSILLTTLTAKSYAAEVASPVASLLDFVRNVVAQIPSFIGRVEIGGRSRYSVMNPVNGQEENFAENWTNRNYEAFLIWHRKLSTWLRKLEEARGRGADTMLTELSANFGNDRVIKAANAIGVETRSLQEAGKVRVDNLSGKLGAVGAIIPKTVNFGA